MCSPFTVFLLPLSIITICNGTQHASKYVKAAYTGGSLVLELDTDRSDVDEDVDLT